jgi:autotransporter-associated beta strand protein
MDYPQLRALLLSGAFLLLNNAALHAGSATWNLSPTSGDWNTAANWTPATVPNSAADQATFDISNTTALTLSAATQVNGIIFNPGASPYTITVGPASLVLTISGLGIQNESGIAQNFVTANDPAGHAGIISFANRAGAGDATFANMGGQTSIIGVGITEFQDSSTAERATFINYGGAVDGPPGSPALGGAAKFFDSSTAGRANFTNYGGTISVANGGLAEFWNESTAGRATFTLNPGVVNGGEAAFYDNASADRGTFIANAGTIGKRGGGFIVFLRSSTAGQATFIIDGGTNGGRGGFVAFDETSTGGTAQFTLSGNGTLSITAHDAPGLSVGSIEGDGTILLGNRKLTVTTDTRNTVFSGKIEEAPFVGGSFAKDGQATLTLTGRNTYTGGTTVTAGALVVRNRVGSGTGTGPVQVDGGTLGGKGIISGAVTIGTGAGPGASLAPAHGTGNPATLTILNSLTFQADASYVYTFTATDGTPRADQVSASGATIAAGAVFSFGAVQGTLQIGTVLTAIDNTAATPIAGTFSNLPDGSTITIGGNTFQADYEGGDGNDLTLTVVP